MINIILPIISVFVVAITVVIKISYEKGYENGCIRGGLTAKDSILEQISSGELFVKDGILTSKDGLLKIRYR